MSKTHYHHELRRLPIQDTQTHEVQPKWHHSMPLGIRVYLDKKTGEYR